MQTLITATQMKRADADAIENLGIPSIELMERAAKAFVREFKKEVPDRATTISILCGKGNNGGDGLAIAMLLSAAAYRNVEVFVINFMARESHDFSENLRSLQQAQIKINYIDVAAQLLLNCDVIIDAILGAGLNKPLTGEFESLAKKVNEYQKKKVVAVDVPTGFNGDGPIGTVFNGIKADVVISFQRPKINFFFPESAFALNRFKVVDIGLSETFIENEPSPWKLTNAEDIRRLLRPRKNFTHKGTYGHALLVAGDCTTMGAALLSARSCLLSGAGLTTVCIPLSGFTAVNATLPEVMTLERTTLQMSASLSKYKAVGVGPGLGVNSEAEHLIEQLLQEKKPIVVDADGLTILSQRSDLLDKLEAGSILTPHMKEFDRIFGEHENWMDRVLTARNAASERQIVIVLKNQFTFVCLPTGEVFINPTGNPAMSSGGMGDVLTGVITSLLAQSYSSTDAAILSVYLHGKAGDILAKSNGVVIASKVAEEIPRLLKKYSVSDS